MVGEDPLTRVMTPLSLIKGLPHHSFPSGPLSFLIPTSRPAPRNLDFWPWLLSLLPLSCLRVSLHFPRGRVKPISLEARNLTPAPLKQTHPEPDFMAFEMMRDQEGGVRLRWWKKEPYPQSCLVTVHWDCASRGGKGTTPNPFLPSPTTPASSSLVYMEDRRNTNAIYCRSEHLFMAV